MLQLESHDEDNHALRLVSDHFNLLSERKWNNIARFMGISTDEVKVVVDRIRSFGCVLRFEYTS